MLLRVLPYRKGWHHQAVTEAIHLQNPIIDLCEKLSSILTQFYVVTSPYGVALFPYHQGVILLFPELRVTQGTLWRYQRQRLIPIAPVDSDQLSVPSTLRRIFTAPTHGYYSPQAGFLPLLDSTQLGTPSRFPVLAIPQTALPEQMQHSRVLQLWQVRSWLQTPMDYHAVPSGGTVYEHSEQIWIQFQLAGMDAWFVKSRNHTLDPLYHIRWAIERVDEAKTEMRLGKLPLYEALRLDDPSVQFGLLCSHPQDRFIQELRERARDEVSIYHRVYEDAVEHGRLPISSVYTNSDKVLRIEVLGVYRALDGSTGRFVWHYREKDTKLSTRVPPHYLLRIYLVMSQYYAKRGKQLLELLLAIPGSSIYGAPERVQLFSLDSYDVDAQGQLVIPPDIQWVYPPPMTVRDLFIDTGQPSYRLIQPYVLNPTECTPVDLPIHIADW